MIKGKTRKVKHVN